jgi:hypothetical protein
MKAGSNGYPNLIMAMPMLLIKDGKRAEEKFWHG